MHLVERLEAEHRQFVKDLEDLREAVELAQGGMDPNAVLERMGRLVPLLRDEVGIHAEREETLLFPAMKERGANELIDLLLGEHRDVRALYTSLDETYEHWHTDPERPADVWANSALDLRGKFSAHMQKENIQLFPKAKRILPTDMLEDLTRRW